MVAAGAGGKRTWEMIVKGYEVSDMQDKYILETDHTV